MGRRRDFKFLGKRSRCQITLSGFLGVVSDFSYPSPAREFHDSVVRRDHRPEFVKRGPANDDVRIVMVWVSIGPLSEGDLRVLAPSWPLFDRRSGVGFLGRGTVSPGCRSADYDVYLLFNWLIRSRGGVPVPTGPFLGGPSISDEAMEMPFANEVLDLVLRLLHSSVS
ncbi:hypothetical protein B296_00023980 [Ensete ventricosum]|uniref:Uncharacterized protein n=1 Tax=Ensete ventricosum TaxID=4639 RepID=A0A426YHF6_ENSVE|nr:hypothetical protein B296_00023980 [Ensete ventricosum]